MLDARTTQFIRTSADDFLEFVMDVERYAEIDEKIRPVRWSRRDGDLTEFAFRPSALGLKWPTWVPQMRRTPGERVDIVLAPAPHNRFARVITHYEASFECVPVDGGVEVTRSERFEVHRPFKWVLEPALRRTMPALVREELRLAKAKLESAQPAGA
jgi:hypothetical protein